MKAFKLILIICFALFSTISFAQQKVVIEGQLPSMTAGDKLYYFYKKGFDQPEITDSIILRNRKIQFELAINEPTLVTLVYSDKKDKSLADLQAEAHTMDAIGFMADTGAIKLAFDGSLMKFNASKASPLFHDFRELKRLTTLIPRERMDSINKLYTDQSSENYQLAAEKVIQQSSQEIVDFLNKHLNTYTGLLTMQYLTSLHPELIPQLSDALQHHYSEELRHTGLGQHLLATFQRQTTANQN